MTIDDSSHSPRTPWRRRRGQSRPDDVIRSPPGLRRVFRGLPLPNDIIRSLRGLSHYLRGLSWPYDVLRSPRGLRRPHRGLLWPDNVIVLHVNYVVFPEVYHDQTMVFVVMTRGPWRRRQGQSRPDDFIHSLRGLRHFPWSLLWPDDGFRSPRRLRRVLRHSHFYWTILFRVPVD